MCGCGHPAPGRRRASVCSTNRDSPSRRDFPFAHTSSGTPPPENRGPLPLSSTGIPLLSATLKFSLRLTGSRVELLTIPVGSPFPANWVTPSAPSRLPTPQLVTAGTYVNKDGDGKLLVNASASIPSPNSIEPASWNCGGTNFQGSSCKAAVALEPPDAESSRSEDLVFWSTLGGLLLSICGGALIASVRQLVKKTARL
jgi:hypothetical protein